LGLGILKSVKVLGIAVPLAEALGLMLLFNFHLLMPDRGENNAPRTGLSQIG
jgi:hypothetical protein